MEHDAQAQAAVLFEVAERELRPSWFDAQANLDRELTAVAKLSARACYVLFLLVTFSLALVRGAGPDAIERLGALLLLIEWLVPFVPLLCWLAVDYPAVSLLLLTLFAEFIARKTRLQRTE